MTVGSDRGRPLAKGGPNVENVTSDHDISTVGVATDTRSHDTAAALGVLLRREGVARANDGVDTWWKSCCDAAIVFLAWQGRPFTSDDVTALIPPPDRPCWVGARFYAARVAGVIRFAGFTTSRRPSRHAGVVRVWVPGEAA